MLHIIQKEILHRLIENPELRYSKLKPKHIESNHFMYHLRALMRDGMVKKKLSGSYGLTKAGKLYVDQLNLRTLKTRRQPKIVTLVAVQNADQAWLLYQRRHQPLIDQIGFPYGKLHLGETIQEAAQRELMEKTGLTCPLEHRGDGYITIHEDGEPVSQICFHLFYGKDPSGTMRVKTNYGTVHWSKPEDDFTKPPFMASMQDLVGLLETKNDRFFVELVY